MVFLFFLEFSVCFSGIDYCNQVLDKMSDSKPIIAEYGSWWSPIDAKILGGGNCKVINELQCGESKFCFLSL